MKILFVFTGGTIGSVLDGNSICIDKAQPYALLNEYSKRYSLDFDYDVIEPYRILSEGNTGIELHSLISALSGVERYDGIIVTHGTDTLQYTAAALGYCFGNSCAPICIVSSNYPLNDFRANGLYNLFGAISLIKAQSAKGVFVTYKNSHEEKISVHRATRLLAHEAFSDSLYSIKGSEYGYFDLNGELTSGKGFDEPNDALIAPNIDNISGFSKSIIRLSAHVGMNYPVIGEGIKYILIDSYHSGTVDTASSVAREFYLNAKKRGVRIFLSGAYGDTQYQSADAFDLLGIEPIKDIAPIALYVKLWLYSLENEVDAGLLGSARAGDIR